jgi:uncharacterized protein (TIGR04255 family)
MVSMGSGPKYPNQQLRSVSLETYFPGELGAFSKFGAVQGALRESLPNLFVPNLQPGEPVALRPFQLRDVEQTRSLALAVNQATYISFRYPGYDSFAEEAVAIVASALAHLEPAKLNRVVYRYENELGIAREANGELGIERIFPGVISNVFVEGDMFGAAKALDIAAEHAWRAEGFEGARGFHARTEDVGASLVFKLTVFGAVEGCAVADLDRAAAIAHRVGFSLFEALISPAFREFISANQGESADAG